ncbi:MAG: nitric oxide reductase activation protein [Eubacteriales bacterium]|nr:nitric oxide reductase activation protein [Eubacteriales bacterium]
MENINYDPEEYRMEIENRMKNLMWTVSGNYELDIHLDLESFQKSKYISMYDAIKQGAFAQYFDREQLAGYIVRKVYFQADERALMNVAQLCVDAASYAKISTDRPGVPQIREKAMEDILEYDFERLNRSDAGRMEIAWMRGCLRDDWKMEKKLLEPIQKIKELKDAKNTMEIIQCIDHLYNGWIDPTFEKRCGTLETVMDVTLEDLKEFDWKDFLEDELEESVLEQYMQQVENQLSNLNSGQDREEKEEQRKNKKKNIVVLKQEDIEKMYQYMELNYGRSYLTEQEQKKRNYQMCRGAHEDCSLYYTDGILKNPVRVNAQYVNAKKQREKNEVEYHNHHNMAKRNIEIMTANLKRSLLQRNETEYLASDYGILVPKLLWKVGRGRTNHLFLKENKRENSDFAVQILMDASGSQRERQGQISLQAYIISESLSNVQIPHKVASFCTFWDYTVIQRFREYDDPRTENKNVFQYRTSSNNRDGLAIRAAGESLIQRPEENKILIVLSDGKPNDVVVNRPNSKNPQSYCGEYAVRDTAFEVRSLRNKGIFVLGVFTGKEEDLKAEQKIFGKDFAYISAIENFSNIVGIYLRRLLEWETEQF